MRRHAVGNLFRRIGQFAQFFRHRFALRRNPVDRFRVNDGNALQLIYKIFEIGKFRFERDDAFFGFDIRRQLLTNFSNSGAGDLPLFKVFVCVNDVEVNAVESRIDNFLNI